MRRLRAELRAFAQTVFEVATTLDSASPRWPFLTFRDNARAQERVAAVRAGTQKVSL